jgi:hypothetical protein
VTPLRWTVGDLCRSVPLGEREWIILIRAFLDASGQKTDPVVVVAGFIGWPANWEHFEKQWNAFLNEFQLERFHATDFWLRRRPYSRWSDAQFLKATGDICKILSDEMGPPLGISVSLSVQAFNDWRETLDHFYPADPYYFCLDRVLYTLAYATGPGAEDITIYCDQEKEHELLATEIARWHEARVNKTPSLATNPLSGPRGIDVHYGSNRKFVPLQLADILANDTFRMISDHLRTGQINEPFFTRCLKGGKHKDKERIVTYFYRDVQMLTLDHLSRSRDAKTILIEKT